MSHYPTVIEARYIPRTERGLWMGLGYEVTEIRDVNGNLASPHAEYSLLASKKIRGAKKMSRYRTTHHKIEREQTGLNGAIHIHVEHDGKGKIHSIWLSHKWKDNSSLDKVFHALGDATTAAVREAQG